jgi:hypothetical protein
MIECAGEFQPQWSRHSIAPTSSMMVEIVTGSLWHDRDLCRIFVGNLARGGNKVARVHRWMTM